MVDVGQKPITHRSATAAGHVLMQPDTLRLIQSGTAAKGNVLETARLAGIMAAKKTPELIPLCHSVPLTQVRIDFRFVPDNRLEVSCTVSAEARTGVEMEALTAVSAACLTVYDMCKSADRGMEIDGIRLLRKTGGQSGDFFRNSP
jgi:cyclic pyranopterin phosphate synthase